VPSDATPAITGTVTKLDRRALPAGAVVTVQLQDVSLADAPATVVGEHVITTGGEQVPIPFSIEYDADAIDERNSYSLRATITIDGDLRYTSTQSYPVITHGYPADDVEILVRMVG
jgi:putative lipoprotein